MKKKDSWITITDKFQYTLLGFSHDTNKNQLYVEDYIVVALPKNQDTNYIRTDINLTKVSAFPKVKFGLVKHHSKDLKYFFGGTMQWNEGSLYCNEIIYIF